ncbi:MAG: hypothetical protein JXB47_18855 [Anaerolineae bacterium]|nr:hypothetical protein [Anaerolineae bacterium]
MLWRKRLPPILALALAALAAAPLLGPGFLNTRAGGDSPFLLFRLHQLCKALGDGVFPVRWMPDAAFGFGYPFFSYYAALPYYIAAFFKSVGFSYVAALKLTQLAGFLLAAGAMYAWTRRHMRTGWGALLAAAAYTFAPFHMVNVYVRGDSLSEFYAFVFYPLALLAADRLSERRTPARAAWLGLAYAGLLLTHNISAFIFSPFLGLYLLALPLAPSSPALPSQGGKGAGARSESPFAPCGRGDLGERGMGMRRVLRAYNAYAAAILLGVMVAAGFWLPAVGELDAVQLEDSTTGYFHYSNHFRDFSNLVQYSFVFNYGVDPNIQTTPFSTSALQFVLLWAGLLILGWRARRSGERWFAGFLCLGLAISIFLIMPVSRFVWDNLPMLPVVQFPWRFLSVFALFAAALIGYAADVFSAVVRENKSSAIRRSVPATVAVVLSLALAASAMLGIHPDFVPLNDHDVTPEALQLYEYFGGNIGTTIRYEWLPRAVNPRPYTGPEFMNLELRVKSAGGWVESIRNLKRAASQEWVVSVPGEAADIAIPLYYWPGWMAAVDGRPVELSAEPGLGWARLTVPHGLHRVTLRLGRTPLRALAEWVSVLGAALAAVMLWRWWRARAFALTTAAALALLAVLLLGLANYPQDEPLEGPQTMDFAQEAYPYHAPGGVAFEDGARLLDYEYRFAGAACLSLTLATDWRGADGAALTMTPRLTLPAANVLGIPVDAAVGDPAAVLSTAESDLTPMCPLSPGIYLPVLEITRGGGPLDALTGSGVRRGALALEPVAHQARTMAGGDEEPLAVFDGGLSLLSAELRPGNPNLLLRWRADAELMRNYHVGLRLRDAAGNLWAEQDAPLGLYGAYPPALWMPGEAVYEGYFLPLPDGMPPGPYTLYVNVYDAATGESIGDRRVDDRYWSGYTPAPAGVRRWYTPLPALSIAGLEAPAAVTAGRPFPLTVHWIVETAPGIDYRARWVLRNDERGVWFVDTPLAPGSSTALWRAGALIEGRLALEPPADLPPGDYLLTLAILGPDGTPLHNPIFVYALDVQAPAVPTGAPEGVPNRVDVDFGGVVRLWGYDVTQTGGALALTLTWGALTETATDYRFFVHLFDPATEAIPVQVDTMPHEFAYPTSIWVPGEVVTDGVTLDLEGVPPGVYRAAVGWYDEAGRLPAVDASGARLDGDRVILPFEVSVP